MDLESGFLFHESEEYTGEVTEDSVSPTGRYEFLDDGCGAVESNYMFPEVKGNGPAVLGSVYLSNEDGKPTMPRKGYGLKKWRRIKRDSDKSGKSSTETGRMLTQHLLDSGGNSGKRMQDYGRRKQKTDNSVSSTDAVVGRMVGFPRHGDSEFGVSSSVSAGTDSGNSGDWSSKSSTAASTPTINFGNLLIAGFLLDKSWKRSPDDKALAHSVQHDHQGKDKIQTTNRGGGERIKTEKGSSHSSVHSDSQSSNFVSVQGTYFSNNGIRNERAKDYGGSCDGGQGSREQVSKGHQGGYNRDVEGESKDLLPEDAATNSSWDIIEERNENLCSSRDQDPLVSSISSLQSVQEALEKELLMFKDMSQEISVNDSVQDLHRECIYANENIKTSSEWSPNSKAIESLTQTREYDMEEETKKDLEAELEDLFRQKMEAELVYLMISRIVSVDQITILEEQKALLSEHAQMLDELGDAENKVMMLKNKAEKLEAVCEDIVIAKEALKLQKRVCKYSSCFILQLVLLAVTLAIFMYQISHHFVEPVPT